MNTAPKSPGIYCITCKTNKMAYVGSAVSLFRRWNEHRCKLRYNRHENIKLQRAWNKYGEDAFTYEVLELVLIPEMLIPREQYWLDKLQPFGHHGFNIERVAGSPLGLKRSPEHCARMSANRLGKKHTPEAIAKMSASQRARPPRKGHAHTPESRAKISRSLQGNTRTSGYKHSPETLAKSRKTYILTSPEGVEQTIHGLNQFCRERELDAGALIKVAQGKFGHYKGWKARYPGSIDTGFVKKERDYSHTRKTYIVTSPEGVECIVQGLPMFCKEHNLTPQSLSMVARGKRSNHKGWKARYAGDEAPRYTGDPRKKTLIVTSPDGTEYVATGINQFCREHGLSSIGLIHVAQGKFKQHKGWVARFADIA